MEIFELEKARSEQKYQAEALTGIYFGSSMPIEFIDIICLIVRGQNTNVEFWRGKRNESQFILDFDPYNPLI